MLKIIQLIFFCLCLLPSLCVAQSLIDIEQLLAEPTAHSLEYFEAFEFEKTKEIDDVCLMTTLKKGRSTVFLYACNTTKDTIEEIGYLFEESALYQNFQKEVNSLEFYTHQLKTLSGSDCDVYTDSIYNYELTLNHFTNVDLFRMSFANAPTFEWHKNHIESGSDYDQAEDWRYMMINLLTTKNSKGQSIEQVLREKHLIEIDESLPLKEFVITFQTTKKFEAFKQTIDEVFIADEEFVNQFQIRAGKLLAALANDDQGYYEAGSQEKEIARIIEKRNFQYTGIVFKYLHDKLTK